MEWNLTTILVLITTLLVGYGLGLLEAYLRNSWKLKEARQKIEELQIAAEGAVPPTGQIPSALQVWINPDQSLVVSLDGSRLENPETGDASQRRRLITLIARLRPWVEGGPAAPVSKKDLLPIKPGAFPLNPTSTPVDAGTAPEPSPATAGKSMVQQIDAVLQELLEGTSLARKRIMLLDSPGGGILVKVGNDQYESIDAVPDDGIQSLIRQAVTKWEKG
jgi:hypothetical protein